jgi:hypothetical protein
VQIAQTMMDVLHEPVEVDALFLLHGASRKNSSIKKLLPRPTGPQR